MNNDFNNQNQPMGPQPVNDTDNRFGLNFNQNISPMPGTMNNSSAPQMPAPDMLNTPTPGMGTNFAPVEPLMDMNPVNAPMPDTLNMANPNPQVMPSANFGNPSNLYGSPTPQMPMDNLGMPMMPPPESVASEPKKKKGKALLFIILAVVAAILGIGVYFFMVFTSPVNVYRKLIDQSVNDVYSALVSEDTKIKGSLGLDLDVKLDQELVDGEILKLINNTTIDFEYQFDFDNKQAVIKMGSEYENANLISGDIYLDAQNEKTYLYVKDYLDKYLEIPIDDYTEIKELFELTKLTDSQKNNIKTAKDIINKELQAIVTKDLIKKENGKMTLTITPQELTKRMASLVENLSKNQKFLDCFDKDIEIDSVLSSLKDELMASEISDNTPLVITIEKGAFDKNIKSLNAKLTDLELTMNETVSGYQYTVKVTSEEIASGKISTRGNATTTEMNINLSEIGKITVIVDTTYETGKAVDMIDSSKTMKFEDLTEDDLADIMTKIENSKLANFITVFENMGFGDDLYEDDDWSVYEDDEWSDWDDTSSWEDEWSWDPSYAD